ncbi:MAG: amino acid ABC transporter substrate-binding protein [Desulfobacteraceae bacterium]|nr:amino acid ABC transporter substrate-binding protein [Desulfobacteraceae bacterium]
MDTVFKWVSGLCVFAVLNFSVIVFAEETIRITTGEWIPYSSSDIKHNGVLCRITTEAFALEGIKVQWGFFPWGRASELAKKGLWDGSIFWYHTPERAKHFIYSDQIGSQSNVFFHLKTYKFDWKTIDDLKGIKIGSTIGYSYGKAFDDADKKGELNNERVPSDEMNFRKLFAGRIQVFPMQMDIAYDLLNRKFASEVQLVTYHPKLLNDLPVYLILSKNKTEQSNRIVKLFNKGLKQIKESGKYDKYFEEVTNGYYSK